MCRIGAYETASVSRVGNGRFAEYHENAVRQRFVRHRVRFDIRSLCYWTGRFHVFFLFLVLICAAAPVPGAARIPDCKYRHFFDTSAVPAPKFLQMAGPVLSSAAALPETRRVLLLLTREGGF